MNDFTKHIYIGDAKQTLATLPSASVDMVLTSPPYANGLRDYGETGQLGMEATVDDWAANVFDALQPLGRVLKESGTLWLDVGDSYSRASREGAPRKSLLLGPERLALRLLDDGWVLRNKIVWAKPNGLPTAVGDRLAHKWEVVYIFARSARYFFDLDAVRVPHTSRPPKRRDSTHPKKRPPADAWQGQHGDRGDGLKRNRALGKVGHDLGKNPGDVWTIPTSVWRGDHHATFPLSLADRCIRAGCPEAVCQACGTPWRRSIERTLGAVAIRSALQQRCTCPEVPSRPGIVLDPFMGSGTTAIAAEKLNRDWLGVELNPVFAGMAMERIVEAREKRQGALK